MSSAAKEAKTKSRRKARQSPEQTREVLVRAALEVFNEVSWSETDTNKIAKAAGYSPGTFYRHFEDKRAIFLAAYELWLAEEWRVVSGQVLTGEEAERKLSKILEELLDHHRRFRTFRRNLRMLVAQDEEVRAAYARHNAASLERVEDVRARLGAGRKEKARTLVQRLAIERLCDAVVDGDFAALGLSDEETRRVIGRFFSDFLARDGA